MPRINQNVARYTVRLSGDKIQWRVICIDHTGTEHAIETPEPLRTRKDCADFVRDLFESGEINCYAAIKLLHSLVE